jgi:hypothetical protein
MSLGASLIFSTTLGVDVTDEQLQSCAQLFSDNYGYWGSRARETSPSLKPGELFSPPNYKTLTCLCLQAPVSGCRPESFSRNILAIRTPSCLPVTVVNRWLVMRSLPAGTMGIQVC